MLNIAIGFTVCLSLVIVVRWWGTSRDVRSLVTRLGQMERAIANLTRRLDIRTSDEKQRVRVLEDIAQVNRGQLKVLLGRLQHIENFLKSQGYELTTDPVTESTTEPRGTLDNGGRLEFKDKGNAHERPNPSGSRSGPVARYIKPKTQTTASRMKNMWGMEN